MFEGVPNHPDFSRFWQVIDKHQVTIFYTAPTAIRALMREGDGPVKKTSRRSLRLLGRDGETSTPADWRSYGDEVCTGTLPTLDTWSPTTHGATLTPPSTDAD